MKPLLAFLPISILAAAPAIAGPGHAYFGTGGGAAKGIYRAAFDAEKGKLGAPELAAEIGSPGFLAFDPGRRKLYAAGRMEGKAGVAAYEIAGDGALSLLNFASADGDEGTHISVHPSGKFLLTAHYGGGATALFPLGADGRVGERAQIVKHGAGSGVVKGRQEGPHPHWCGFSPDGRFAFVPDLGMDKIVIYAVDPEKPAIAPHGFADAAPGSGPRHMRFSVDGRRIYLIDELTVGVSVFDYDAAAGSAKLVESVPALPEATKAKETSNSGSEVLVHPNGRFVYSANRGHDSVTVFKADEKSGRLSVVEVEPIRGALPRNINLDASGRWLLAAGAESNTISVFAIDAASGELRFQRGSTINVPAPICILIRE